MYVHVDPLTFIFIFILSILIVLAILATIIEAGMAETHSNTQNSLK